MANSSASDLENFFGEIIEESGLSDIAKEVGLLSGSARMTQSDGGAFAMMGGDSSSQGGFGDSGSMGMS